MTERPILFSGPMVRAILEGRKTQTRRVAKTTQCPYGRVVGDRLWVRETFNPDWTDRVIYKADGGSAVEAGWPREPRWKPSIFMPRSACRLVLEVTTVRLERLQEISEADAKAEGCAAGDVVTHQGAMGPFDAEITKNADTAREAYRVLWDSLNAKRAPWASNPWVWVVEFRCLERTAKP